MIHFNRVKCKSPRLVKLFWTISSFQKPNRTRDAWTATHVVRFNYKTWRTWLSDVMTSKVLKQTIKLWNLWQVKLYITSWVRKFIICCGEIQPKLFVTRLEIIMIAAEKWMWCRWTSFSKWRILPRDGENLHGSPRKL